MQAAVATQKVNAIEYRQQNGLKKETRKYYKLLAEYLGGNVDRKPEDSYAGVVRDRFLESQGLP